MAIPRENANQQRFGICLTARGVRTRVVVPAPPSAMTTTRKQQHNCSISPQVRAFPLAPALRTYANLPKAIPFSYHLPPLSRPHAPAVNRREWGNNKNVDHDVSYVKVCDRCSVIKWYACNLNCPTSTSYVWVHAKRWGEIVGAAKDHLNNLLNNDIKTFRKLFGAPRTAVLQEMLPQCAGCARWLTSQCVRAAMEEFTFSDVDAEKVLEALAGISRRACEEVKISACSGTATNKKNFNSFK